MTERTAKEWGRLAVSLPGWRWMPGMFVPSPGYGRLDDDDVSDHPLYRLPLRHADECWPDPDDPATAGCLLALLGDTFAHVATGFGDGFVVCLIVDGTTIEGTGSTLGRACIAAAAALGRWPGGAE